MKQQFFDLSRTLSAETVGTAFGLPRPTLTALLDTHKGNSVNCVQLDKFVVHACGTHTESNAHIDSRGLLISQILPFVPVVMPALLISVVPVVLDSLAEGSEERQDQLHGCSKTQGTDMVIDMASIKNAWVSHGVDGIYDAAIIHACFTNEPNENDYTGKNSTYLTKSAAKFLREKGVRHLLVDLPSVDREDDGGALLAHRAFFSGNEHGTITELCHVPAECVDGRYQLNLQLLSWDMDAAPSRPVIFK